MRAPVFFTEAGFGIEKESTYLKMLTPVPPICLFNFAHRAVAQNCSILEHLEYNSVTSASIVVGTGRALCRGSQGSGAVLLRSKHRQFI